MEEMDFYISKNGRLIIPKYEINYLVNIIESTIPTMPEASETTARVAGRDGDIVLSTTYEPISFNIVCYTNDNLNQSEKDIEEKKINKFLNEMKNTTKKFGIESSGKFYRVKFNGLLSANKYPGHIEFSIPFKSSNSFGYSLDKKMIIGNGKENSNTIKEVGAVFTIVGPALNPIISLNDYSMEYSNTLLEGQKLIIDSSKSTITHINEDGIQANAMKYYNHQFPEIEYGENELKVLSGISDEEQVSIEWYDLML